jgi:hypothetical protein
VILYLEDENLDGIIERWKRRKDVGQNVSSVSVLEYRKWFSRQNETLTEWSFQIYYKSIPVKLRQVVVAR